MSRRPVSLFGLNASGDYAARVARHIDMAVAPHEERVFEDGEHKSRPLQNVEGHDAYVIHSLYGQEDQSPSEKLCRLLFFCGALKDAGAERVTAVAPYLCYARKDRRTKLNDPITTRYVAAMFEAVRVDRVVTVEAHNLSAFENAFRCRTRHIPAAPLFAEHFATILRDQPVVAVSPDAGGAKRAEQFRQALERATGREVTGAMVAKHRSEGVVSGGLLAGEVEGRTAIIIDDLISTGTTLIRAAKACRQAGARRVFGAATHGLFIGGATELLAAPEFERIVVGDTVPGFRVPCETARKRLTILDTAPMVAVAITGLFDAG